jgi:hypothetical protein
VLRTDLSGDAFIDDLIVHVQGLAEVEIPAQTEPVSQALQSALTEIVARKWRAGKSAEINPAALQSETTGPHTFQDVQAGAAGLGLTNREIKAIKKAAGVTGLWIQPTKRGDYLETAPGYDDELVDLTDPVETLAGGQADLPFRP